ncbi:MAG: methylenetetrahydrofolate reductase C-terminal domain-containing protein [Candidatus Aenigmatarchaeota archaeon]
MIVTRQKPYEEILMYLKGKEQIIIFGCSQCATLSGSGGEQEVNELAEKLEADGKRITGKGVLKEPCHLLLTKREIKGFSDEITSSEAALVMSCGAGVQTVASLINIPVFPGCNSLFLASTLRYGHFEEKCSMCGDCMLAYTGGICVVTGCAKHMINGPCGGIKDEKCEIGDGRECVWVSVFKRMRARGELDHLKKVFAPLDHSIKTSIKSVRVNK